MNSLTLKQLRYFAALASQGHFGRAAEICAISQPALSMQIRELENTLGTPLIERGPRKVRLTHFGETFLTRAQDILRSVDELGDLARSAQDGELGRLRLGVIPTVAPYLLPSFLRKLNEDQSSLDIRVRETVTPRLIEELREGQIDTAIVALPVSEPTFREEPLFEERFVLIRPQTERNAPVPRPEDLPNMQLLLLEEGHCFRDQALSFCNLPRTLPRDGLDGSSLSTLVQMVGAGLGLTLIPDMAVPVETRSADVAVNRFEDPQPSRTLGMIWRKTSPLEEQLTQIAETIRTIAAPDPAEPRIQRI